MRMGLTERSVGATARIVFSATRAASYIGYPKTPVEMEGKATESSRPSSASIKAFL